MSVMHRSGGVMKCFIRFWRRLLVSLAVKVFASLSCVGIVVAWTLANNNDAERWNAMTSTIAQNGMRRTVLQVEQRDVTISGWASFRSSLNGALSKGAGSLVLDLREVRYLFSGVLNALVEARVRVRTLGGNLILIIDNAELLKFFDKIGFDKLFDIVMDEEAALSVLAVTEAE